MKILKGILIALLALVVIYLAASFVLPKKLKVQKTTSINAPADLIYSEVTDFHTWNRWSPWNQMDSNMTNVYSEESGTIGAWTSWESEVVGDGWQKIVEVERPIYAKYAMTFGEHTDTNYAVFELEEKEEGVTTVTWSMDGAEMPFYMRPMAAIWKPMIEENYVQGLKSLKENMEAKSLELKEMKAGDNSSQIQIVKLEPIKILTILDSTNSEGISNKLAEIYAEISNYISSTEGLEQSGMPLSLYHFYSEDKVILEAGLPYDGNAVENGRIKLKETQAGKTVMKVHYGSYASSEISHEEIYKYIQDNNYEIAGPVWEVYANDPTMVSEDEIQTNIYYPIK